MNGKPVRFRDELKDFFAFLRRPTLSRRHVIRRTGNAVQVDWFVAATFKRLLCWAVCLWAINMALFGPLAASVAGATGAQHRLDITNLPWLQALIWAPIVEELVFRYGLRRPLQFVWLGPIVVTCLFSGPVWYSIALVALLVLLLMQPAWSNVSLRASATTATGWRLWMQRLSGKQPMPMKFARWYVRYFGWVMYLATIAFACLHLYNFNFGNGPWLLLPLLVLPQLVTGLVLAWLRVRRGIAASMALHAIFNSGPLLLVWIIVSTLPEQML